MDLVEYIQHKKQMEERKHVTSKDLFQKLSLTPLPESTSNTDVQNITNTMFPKNTPAYIVGTKGSGKTYLLASIFQYAFNNNDFKRIFYIYGNNVDTTLSRALPATVLINVPNNVAEEFLTIYLRKKTKYCSCSRFLQSLRSFPHGTYNDHVLEEIMKRKHFDIDLLKNYCEKVVNRYENTGLKIKIRNDAEIDVGSFSANDFDAFIIDDIAQFPNLFKNSVASRRSKLYQYFTITRQNQTTFYLAGQELQQLPKSFRSQLGAIIILKGIDAIDVLKNVAITKNKLFEIYDKWPMLKKHEGVVYNINEQEYEWIKV